MDTSALLPLPQPPRLTRSATPVHVCAWNFSWLTRDNVPNAPLHALVERIKGFNARRRLRGAIKGVQAGLRLHHLAAHGAQSYGSMAVAAGAGGAGAGAKGDGNEERKAQAVGN